MKDDAISRQAAIDLFLAEGMITAAIYVERMPPVQPEIVYCKDCKKHNVEIGYADEICPLISIRGKVKEHEFDYQFCAYGKRKTGMKPNCWDCKYFERVRMSAFCHGGKRITKLRQKDWYSGSIQFCTYFKPKDRVIKEEVEERKVTQPDPEEWNNHTVACLLAELFGDTCACNYNGIDEWLPEKCEVIDTCPNPVGVACWEQFLKHRAERRTE